MAELLQLEIGRPEVIALQYDAGRRIPSKRPGAPDNMMYSLNDSRRMFVPLTAAEEIEKLQIGRDEPFSICRRAANRYEVQRIDTPQAAAPPSVATQRNGTAAQVMPQQQAHVNAPPPVRWDELEATAPPAPSTNAAKMMACFMAAIEAISEAEVFAERKNLVLNFSSDNITSAALSIYINESKAGR